MLLQSTVTPLTLEQSAPHVPQIREAVDALQNEGHLYSTIDENHFKVRAHDQRRLWGTGWWCSRTEHVLGALPPVD